MKPFNLKEALAGKPVITRDGDEVTNIVKFDVCDNPYSVAGLHNGNIRTWTEEGKFDIFSQIKLNDFDLFMDSEDQII